MVYYELMMRGSDRNYDRLFSFTIYDESDKGWLRLKLNTIQTLNNGEFTRSDFDESILMNQENNYNYQYQTWRARRNRWGQIYLFRPFGGTGAFMLEESDEVTPIQTLLE